jgi:hypothetical protein
MFKLDSNSTSRFKAQVRHHHRFTDGPATWDAWVNPGQPTDKRSKRTLWIVLGVLAVLLCLGGVIAGFMLMEAPV